MQKIFLLLSQWHFICLVGVLKDSLARLIQNGFTGEAKAGEARKTGFSRLLVHFNPGLQNGFTLQCLDLRKIDEAEADISRAKEALNVNLSSCSKQVTPNNVDIAKVAPKYHLYTPAEVEAVIARL